MKCGYEYCIYNENLKCLVNEPEINSLAMCDACIVISLDKEFLEKEKKNKLLELENRWDKNTE